MCVHLLTNASLLGGVASFQGNVNTIHALGPALPLIEWLFIFGPILFHAIAGVWIAMSGASNISRYKYTANRRYSWQRITGYIAFAFIFVHVFHLHGWFHFDWWMKNVAEPLGMAQFKPFNASSTLAIALSGYVWPVFYAVGVLSCCYHLANGIWTSGITWGVWLTPKAQAKATVACTIFGVFLAVIGLSALWAAKTTDPNQAREVEEKMIKEQQERGIDVDPHKRSTPHHDESSTTMVGLGSSSNSTVK
jgi:succinate dehydrogenase / fumarate reductase cytochrome b subunit